MRRLLIPAFIIITGFSASAQKHPVSFATPSELETVSQSITKYPLLNQSFNDIKSQVDRYVGTDVDVPFPKDPAGGYTHDKHKANYMLMFNSGLMYNLTKDPKYAQLVKNILLKYAVLNPTLKNHPEATSSSPGRIFWQALNDANWMVYAGMAYDLIYNYLTPAERKSIENGAFKPEVEYFTTTLKDWFDLLHNHAVWACAGVGIIGIATNNQAYIDMALKGSNKNGERGFLAQMDHLFSPDGYYTEGPYYTRYAILPYMMLANAINNYQPELKIFEYRNRILEKALNTCLQQTNLDGTFFPLNDALKEKDFTTNELVTAISIAWEEYGGDEQYLPIAKKQNRVLLNKGGIEIARMLATKNITSFFKYRTIESTDGVKGDQGGVSILRNGTGDSLTSLIFKYTSHGLSHGHFDKLNINLYDKGKEILQDYGSVRFIGVEQKYGGRYLRENTRYAAQTIAHNTIVVDESSHFNGNSNIANQYHSNKLFSDTRYQNLQVVISAENNAYKDVQLQRGAYLVQIPGGNKLVIDLFSVNTKNEHQYDLPFHYLGQFIYSSFSYNPATDRLETLGKKNGYQYLWKEAEAKVSDTIAQFTFLNNHTYYSISSLIDGQAQIFFARSGANDPDFNLRHDPAYIIRQKAKNKIFINVLEIHGNHDPVNEFSSGSHPSVQQINLLHHDHTATIAAIHINGKKLLIAQSHTDFSKKTKHAYTINNKIIEWTGPYALWYNDKSLINK